MLNTCTNTWSSALAEEKEKPYFKSILAALEKKRLDGETIYPAKADIFNAFRFTPLANIKVVILGQDPYHGPGQAHGLCFSVTKGILAPPSLKNIFRALEADLKISPPPHGCLDLWAQQGAFLLNTYLSVAKGQPQSHAKLGWEQFTDAVIKIICSQDRPIVFLLWGAHAQKKAAFVHNTKHLVLKAPHPSPLSAHRGFLTCQHFSKANDWLAKHSVSPMSWQLHVK